MGMDDHYAEVEADRLNEKPWARRLETESPSGGMQRSRNDSERDSNAIPKRGERSLYDLRDEREGK